MNPEHPIQSREVCCCGVRSWALVVGWFQTIVSAVGTILIGILLFTTMPGVSHEYGDLGNVTVETMAALVISLIIKFAAGIALIVGVKQVREEKLKFWCLIQTTLIVLNFFRLVALVIVTNDQGVSAIQSGLGISVNVFCLWVVKVHRQEIMQRSVPRVEKV